MAAVERLVAVADRRELLGADAVHHALHLLGERQHQHEGDFRAGDVGAPADGEHLDAARLAGAGVDVARAGAELLHRHEVAADGEIVASDRQRFDDQRLAAGKLQPHLLRGVDEPHLRRIERRRARTDALAVALEVALVVGEEIREGRDALLRRRRIEHDADDAQEAIVFDHQHRTSGYRHVRLRHRSRRIAAVWSSASPRSSPRKRGPSATSSDHAALGPRLRGDERRWYARQAQRSVLSKVQAVQDRARAR